MNLPQEDLNSGSSASWLSWLFVAPLEETQDGTRMPGIVVMPVTPALGKLKQGVGESMANLGYVAIVSSKRREGGTIMDHHRSNFSTGYYGSVGSHWVT